METIYNTPWALLALFFTVMGSRKEVTSVEIMNVAGKFLRVPARVSIEAES